MSAAKILVAQDKLVVAKSIQEKIEGMNYVVPAVVSTGEDAIKTTEELKPDLVLIDVSLPGEIDGITAARVISRRSNTPVLFLADNVSEDLFNITGISEPFAFVEKPFNTNVLRSNIEFALYKHQIEARLVESETKLRTIFDNAHIGIAIMSSDGLIYQANPGLREMLGYNEGELQGINFKDLIYPADCEPRQVNFADEYDAGKMEKRFVRKDGRLLWVRFGVSQVRDRGSRLQSFICMAEDVTQRRMAEERWYQSMKMQAVGTFAGGIAHEFNNILTVIMGHTQLLQMKTRPGDPLRTHIDKIIASTESAASLTGDFLTFSGRLPSSPKPSDLNQIIGSLEKTLVKLVGERIVLETGFFEEGLAIMADPKELDQVLTHLVTNARDAIDGEGRINISTAIAEMDDSYIKTHGYGRPGKYALLVISDTGSGIDEGTRKRIYEPFFSTKGVGKGKGLGLALVYGIVKQHGGYIDCHSEPGEGTTFKLYFPLIKEEIVEPESVSTHITKRHAHSILIAEDSGDLLSITAELLAESGYKVFEARDGEEAISKFKEHKDDIDLLIFDVVMPKKNGREAYEMIRTIKPEVKVLFTSGYAADIVRGQGILDEGSDLFTKPYSFLDLKKKVEGLLKD